MKLIAATVTDIVSRTAMLLATLAFDLLMGFGMLLSLGRVNFSGEPNTVYDNVFSVAVILLSLIQATAACFFYKRKITKPFVIVFGIALLFLGGQVVAGGIQASFNYWPIPFLCACLALFYSLHRFAAPFSRFKVSDRPQPKATAKASS